MKTTRKALPPQSRNRRKPDLAERGLRIERRAYQASAQEGGPNLDPDPAQSPASPTEGNRT